jgi:hypothetical protein
MHSRSVIGSVSRGAAFCPWRSAGREGYWRTPSSGSHPESKESNTEKQARPTESTEIRIWGSTNHRAKRPNSFLLRGLRGPRLFLRVKTLTFFASNAAREEVYILKGSTRGSADAAVTFEMESNDVAARDAQARLEHDGVMCSPPGRSPVKPRAHNVRESPHLRIWHVVTPREIVRREQENILNACFLTRARQSVRAALR